jgi:chromosome partitioning protein
MVQVISINNFKGGVSKTSSTAGISYVLSEIMQYNVLVVDLDPQADVTDILLKSFDAQHNDLIEQIMHAENLDELLEDNENEILDALLRKSKTVNNDDLYHTLKDNKRIDNAVIELSDNLDLIPSDFNMIGYPYLLEDLKLSRIDGAKYFNSFLEDIKENYDFVLIDTPPTLSDFANSGIYACDYSLIVVQTHIRSFNAVEKLLSHLSHFKGMYDNDFDVIGLLPVMFKNKGRIDDFVMKMLKNVYEDNVFENLVKQRERVKSWDVTGIKNQDMHDREALKMYGNIAKELIERIGDNNE